MRFVSAIRAFPTMILALPITAALGPSIANAMLAIGFVAAPGIARLTRGQTLSVREREFVSAARVCGATPLDIMRHHIWPNVTAPIIVQATLLMGTAIVTEAALSFLGVGVRPPTASLGAMLRTGSPDLEVAPWIGLHAGAHGSGQHQCHTQTRGASHDSADERLRVDGPDLRQRSNRGVGLRLAADMAPESRRHVWGPAPPGEVLRDVPEQDCLPPPRRS